MPAIRRNRNQPKLVKEKCEVCGCTSVDALNIHHIIPRADPKSHNNNSNLAIICANCHNEVHAGNIILLGVYQSTGGRILMWHKKEDEAPLEKEYWMVKPEKNKKVLRKKSI